jgi:hypothetical protein
MLKTLYAVDRKSERSLLRLFWYYVEICVVSAYVLCSFGSAHRSLKLKDFQRIVITGLDGYKSCNRSPGQSDALEIKRFRSAVPMEKQQSEAKHMPVHGSS